MEIRVEQLSAETDTSVDTIRYYQSKGILDPPRREGRVAWYGEAHVERLARIRNLQEQGFSLATIARVLKGELDAADQALVGELTKVSRPRPSGDTSPGDGSDTGGTTYTLEELAQIIGVPTPLLQAVVNDGLLVPQRIGSEDRFNQEDVAAAQAGLLLLEWGVPLTDLLDLARRYHQATVEVAQAAVSLFSEHVRSPLRQADLAETPEPRTEVLLEAYGQMLPATTTLVTHHFQRTLIQAALAHVETGGQNLDATAPLGPGAPFEGTASSDRTVTHRSVVP